MSEKVQQLQPMYINGLGWLSIAALVAGVGYGLAGWDPRFAVGVGSAVGLTLALGMVLLVAVLMAGIRVVLARLERATADATADAVGKAARELGRAVTAAAGGDA